MITGKILIASSAYRMTSGLAWSLLGLSRYLKEKNVDFCVLLPRHGDLEKKLTEVGVSCKVIYYHKFGWYENINRKPVTSVQKIKNCVKLAINKVALIKIKQLIKKENIHLIHINALTDDICARAAIATNTKFIWHIREFMEEDLGIRFCDQNRAKAEMDCASKIIAVSEGVKNKFQTLTKCEVKVVYNGIDFDRFYSNRTILNNDTITICIAGRITPQKGQMQVIDAIISLRRKGYDNIKAKVIGTVRDKAYMDRMVEKLSDAKCSDCVEFIPFTEKIEDYYKNADIICVCSEKEAFGRVTIEGMASGACVIGMDTGGTSELLEDGVTGYLYDNDKIKLEDIIIKVICDPIHASNIARAGQKWASENFTTQINATRILAVYQEVFDR